MELKKKILMVAGPAQIETEVSNAGSYEMVYNRTDEFSSFLLEVEANLKRLFFTKNDVYIISSSGTGAMECAVVNLLSPGDEVLIISSGTFGYRWYEIALKYNIKCNLLSIPQGIAVKPEEIEARMSTNIKAVFVTANETSSGILIDLERIASLIIKHDAVLVVDAVSSLGADLIKTDEWGCDVVISSSQKALALPPGISFISVSDKAWQLIEKSTTPKFYFDLKSYRDNITRGQTPFTPAISLLYQLDIRLKKIIAEGVENVIIRHNLKAKYLRNKLQAIGLKVIGERPSNGVTGIYFPENVNAYSVIIKLREEYGVEITPSPGDDKNKIARIGVYGDVKFSDIDYLIESLKIILSKYPS